MYELFVTSIAFVGVKQGLFKIESCFLFGSFLLNILLLDLHARFSKKFCVWT